MLKKLLIALVASAFAIGVYAQAPKSGTTKAEPKGQTGVATKKAVPGKGKSDTKGEKKAKGKSEAKKKDGKKDAKKDAK